MNGCLGPVHFETGLSGLSNKSAGSTLLMQRPLIGERADAYYDCIWAHSCRTNSPWVSVSMNQACLNFLIRNFSLGRLA
jgi:hypothetical protein